MVLDRFGLESAYHHAHRVEMGQEPSGTLFFRRKADAAYHIDYCFLPATWRERIQEVTLGSAEKWIALSDHAPIAVDVKV